MAECRRAVVMLPVFLAALLAIGSECAESVEAYNIDTSFQGNPGFNYLNLINHKRIRRDVAVVENATSAPTNVTVSTTVSNMTTTLLATTEAAVKPTNASITPSAVTTATPIKINSTDNKTSAVTVVSEPIAVTTSAPTAPIIPTPTVNTTIEANNNTQNVTVPPIPPPNKKKNEKKPIVSNNTTVINKNLGENGTGIRRNECDYNKNNNSTANCVSEPITAVNDENYNIDNFSMTPEVDYDKFNITLLVANHDYYNSTFLTDKKTFDDYWKLLLNSGDVVVHSLLSKSFGKAVATTLSFSFPFYGRLTNNIRIATGGFIFVGDHPYDWIVQAQYVAPFMANFDPSLQNNSSVKYIDNGTAFTVIWENVLIPERKANGSFTFALTLHRDGNIVFAYKDIPIAISSLNHTLHPVKVGLSDAFVKDYVESFVPRKAIVRYHKINFKQYAITNNSLIYLMPLPTCIQYHSCEGCINHNTAFECTWCASANLCSNGFDRQQQDWTEKNCMKVNITKIDQCMIKKTVVASEGSSATTIANVFIPLVIIVAVLGWFVYAYRNPHTYSGQLLIKYRPSQWSWRRGEARYTAATIHM